MNNENKVMNVEMFRKAGYRVNVTHYRPLLNDLEKRILPYLPKRMKTSMIMEHSINLRDIRKENKQALIFPRGGLTSVSLEKDGELYSAAAECSADDYYRSSYGVAKCLWRISAQLKANGKSI